MGASYVPWIIHVDMDAFFASVEQLDDPCLRGRPVIIGEGERGVVSTASYEARAFGVHSAMPVREARRLCPYGVFLPGRKERYAEVSAVVMETLGRFSPRVERASVDEAYLDAAGLERLFGPVEALARRIKRAVHAATGGLTCSAGVAPVKFLAKIASDMRKPDGLFVVRPEEVPGFLASLPVGRLPGVGRRMQERLRLLHVATAGDVLAWPESFWEARFGRAGMLLHQRARGVDPRPVAPVMVPKSESAERTFEQDTTDREVLLRRLLAHAERVGAGLRRQGLRGRTVTLKIRFADFRLITRSHTLPRATSATQTIFDTAAALLRATPLPRPVRLVGVAVSGFDARPEQLLLEGTPAGDGPSPEAEARRRRLDGALDDLRRRFGPAAVVRGRLFPGGDG
ncbi:MAG: DNA polymerase IV [Desulfovibrionaceae bacterium]|nr:DNA polymerase IV [Desulfovibrionaceae bacterium]